MVMGTVLAAQTAVINEFSSDPSVFDGSGGEFVELYCPAGGGACDISCWVISDGQGLVTIPDGTTIPDGGYYVIAHGPAFICDSCDFFGYPLDLNTATCGCLSGGSYETGVDGNPAFIIGRFGNAGELMLLYDNAGTLLESWAFDNASAAYLPNGGLINSSAVGSCPATSINIIDPDSNIVTNIDSILLGCNTSYLRATDGGAAWTTNDHPTPGVSNANMGNAAYEFMYRVDGGAWITLTETVGANEHSDAATICTGDSIQFQTIIHNYQHAVLEVFDSAGRYGSYYQSPNTGLIAWANISGQGTALGDSLIFMSNNEAIAAGNSDFVLQWSDFKNGQGSFSPTSSNECYERMSFTLTRNQTIDSATIDCTDPVSGISSVTAYPIGIDGQGTDIFFSLYDDIGDQSNLITTNQTGAFQLASAAAPAVGYYVIVTGLCNSVTAIDLGSAFCRADQPCPQITASSFLKNGAACGAVGGTIFTEDFESGSGGYTSSITECTDNGGDYFLLTDGSNINGNFTGATGSFFAAQDIDATGCPVAPGANATLTWSGINIAGATGLQLSVDAAEDDDGSNQDWDAADFVHIEVSIDGGAFVNIIAFESTGATNTEPAQDTDFDGTGDGTALTDAFQTFLGTIAGTGTSLDIRITFDLDSGDEDIAIDNITLSGSVASTCDACPGDTLTFSVEGNNLPQGGTIDWYADPGTGFDPYSGAGTYIGSSNIPVSPDCSSASLAINEVMYRPVTNNGTNPDAGEMIELIGPPGMDLSCFVITDGDWTITIPPGTTMPADGLFTIGNDNVYGAGTFDLDAENCGCFTEGASGSGLLILTDGGEYVSIFDASGTFVQGLIYGTPSATNTPPNGANAVGGVIPTVGTAGCPGSVTIPGPGSFETTGGGVANGTSLIRDPDGTGAWSTQVGGSINDCNALAAPLPVPDFDYIVPISDCNQTLFYKGIINPHPNTVACPNTDPDATTNEFEVQVICPTANIQGEFTVCENATPVSIPITTTGITDATNVSFVHTNNGTADTLTGTVNSNSFTIDVSTTGTYAGVEIIPATGCLGPADSFATVVVVPTPGDPSLPSPMTVCEGDTALVTAFGASTYEWSLVSDFSVIEGTGTDFTVAAPDVVYVRAINTNDSATVSCPGGTDSTVVLTQTCPEIILSQDLLNFEAHKQAETSVLDWTVFNDEPFLGSNFGIERSGDAIQFELIGETPQNNSSAGNHSYQFIDESPLSGWNYYRLRLPQEDFSLQYSAVRALYFGESGHHIAVYPSPVQNQISIDFAEILTEDTEVRVYDVLGIEIGYYQLTKGSKHYQLDLGHYAAGTYALSIGTGEMSKTVKIIKAD